MANPLTNTVSIDTSLSNEKDAKGFSEHVEYKLEAVKEDDIDPEVAKYTNASIVIDEATNKRIRGLLNRRVLPIMLMTYLCQTADKGTLAFSSIEGLKEATHLEGNEYSWLGTVLFFGYLVGEFPMNWIIQRAPLGKFLGGLVFTWGLIVCMHAVAPNFKSLVVVRVLLGLFESGVQPTLMAITCLYYRKEEHAQTISFWYCMQGLQLCLMGLLSYALLFLKDSFPPYKALFLIVGSLTVIWSLCILWLLPDSPMKAKCWSEEDKMLMVERLRSNELALQGKKWKSHQMWEALLDPVVWIILIMQISCFIIVSGLAVFANIIVKGLGFSTAQAQLLNLAQGAVSLLAFLLSAWVARKTNQTIFTTILFVVPAVAGTVVLAAVPVTSKNAGGMLVAFYAVQFVVSTGNLLWSLLTRNIAGQTKVTTVRTLAFLAYGAGCIIGPQVYQAKAAPRYISAWIAHIVLYGVYIVLGIVLRIILMRRNMKKRRAAEASRAHGTAASAAAAAGEVSEGEEVIEHKHSFTDTTDQENPDFRYNY